MLDSYKIKASTLKVELVNDYLYIDIHLDANTRVKTLERYLDEIGLSICAPTRPTIKILREEGVVRLEIVSGKQKVIPIKELLLTNPPNNLCCTVGKNAKGDVVTFDISKQPHTLIAGATGSGKSTLLHVIIANLIAEATSEVILIDPKYSEFSCYKNIHDFKVYHSYAETICVLQYLHSVMEYRYSSMRVGNRNKFKNIVFIIDECADLFMQDSDRSLYKELCTLAQKCRAANIYIIMSTQRPAANIIDGNIKANFSARLSCKVASKVDSKVILDTYGAEHLRGSGDTYIIDSHHYMERFQSAYAEPVTI